MRSEQVDVYSRRGTDPVAAFLHRLTEKHDIENAEFLGDGAGYLTALARHELSGHLDYSTRTHIEKWFQTAAMRLDRFHTFWLPPRLQGSGHPPRTACESPWSPAGTATFAYEVALQRDWSVPDAIVMPLGHGTLFLGVYRGFKALAEAGWIDSVPRLLGAQAAGYAPIASGLHEVPEGENDVADGIQIREPTRKQQLLDAIAETDGDAIAIAEDAVQTELDRLHRRGFYVEPTSAIAPAALAEYRERGTLSSDADVVMPLTGHGMKT